MLFSLRISERPRRLMLVAASSLFLLAATSVPGSYAMDTISDVSAPTTAAELLFPETSADTEIVAMTTVSMGIFI